MYKRRIDHKGWVILISIEIIPKAVVDEQAFPHKATLVLYDKDQKQYVLIDKRSIKEGEFEDFSKDAERIGVKYINNILKPENGSAAKYLQSLGFKEASDPSVQLPEIKRNMYGEPLDQ